MLKGKVILFIGPLFYDYHLQIKRKLEEAGALILFFSERKHGLVYSFGLNVSRQFLLKYQSRYYHSILKSCKRQKIDFLFVIRGCQMPSDFVKNIKKDHPDVKTIMYQWDSQKNNYYIHLKNQFDRILTFDYCDSDKYGIEYYPLFYSDDIKFIHDNPIEKRYDYLYVSGYSYYRYMYLLNLIERSKNVRLKYFLYIPWTTYAKELLKGRKLDKRYLSFSPLTRKEYIDMLGSSHCVIDVGDVNQTGLSIRVIEAIGAGVKVLSTNFFIQKEFSSTGMVGLLSPTTPLIKLVDDGKTCLGNIDKYWIENWVYCFFSINER